MNKITKSEIKSYFTKIILTNQLKAEHFYDVFTDTIAEEIISEIGEEIYIRNSYLVIDNVNYLVKSERQIWLKQDSETEFDSIEVDQDELLDSDEYDLNEYDIEENIFMVNKIKHYFIWLIFTNPEKAWDDYIDFLNYFLAGFANVMSGDDILQ